jgi:hypothetical protein
MSNPNGKENRPPVKLSNLMFALEIPSEETRAYFDRTRGEMIYFSSDLLRRVEEGDEDLLEEIPEWQIGEAELAQEFVNEAFRHRMGRSQ